jgi:hypothetical protein
VSEGKTNKKSNKAPPPKKKPEAKSEQPKSNAQNTHPHCTVHEQLRGILQSGQRRTLTPRRDSKAPRGHSPPLGRALHQWAAATMGRGRGRTTITIATATATATAAAAASAARAACLV